MQTKLSTLIDAPIEQVFDFFDDPARAIAFQDHASQAIDRWQVIDEQPDGRRTIDFFMQTGAKRWMQTIVQEVRDRPFRLVSRSYGWAKNRDEPVSFMTSERRLSVDSGKTRVDVQVKFWLAHPWRNPLAALMNAVWGNQAFRIEQEHALYDIAEYLEGRGKG